MKNHMLFSFLDNAELTDSLAHLLKIELGKLEIRDFPDQETYIRIHDDVKNKMVFLVARLDHPNNKMLPLMFAAQTIKKLGANKVGLIAPYLPYMRQDKCFQSGEAFTSSLFACYLSDWIDCLVTIDPHLHRIKHLQDIYVMNSISVMHAAPKIAEWLMRQKKNFLLIGPDEESEQWIAEIANMAKLSYIIGKKIREGDREVRLMLPTITQKNIIPLLMDDIISTGTTMLAAMQALFTQGLKHSYLMTVHALFDGKIENQLKQAGAHKIISCNTVLHPTNEIDVTTLLATGVSNLC